MVCGIIYMNTGWEWALQNIYYKGSAVQQKQEKINCNMQNIGWRSQMEVQQTTAGQATPN